MPTSYTTSLGLALPADSELTGTWGQTVNAFITNYLDSAIAGAQTISGTQTAVTLSRTTGATLAQAGVTATGSSQYSIINCTGNPASLLTVTVPASSKVYLVINATTTNQQVKIVGVGPTAGVTLDAGESALIAWNGSDFVKVAFSSLFAQNQILYGSATGGFSQSSGLTFNGTNLVTTGTASATKLIPTGGTATGNGMYLPAANTVAVSTNGVEAFRVDASSNLGLGVTPSAWGGSGRAFDITSTGSFEAIGGNSTSFSYNRYFNGTSNIYKTTGFASIYSQNSSGQHAWYTAPSGTAGNPITFTQAMTLDASGNLGLKFTPSAWSSVNYSLQGAGGSFFSIGLDNVATANNVYYDGAYKYVGAYNATMAVQSAGQHAWLTAAVGTAGAAISFTTAMTLDASGNLGIGTSAPSFTLDISTAAPRIRQTATTGTNSSLIQLVNTGGTAYIGLDSSSGGVGTAYSLSLYHSSAYPIVFSTNATERMRLDSSGNLGVGTASPTSTVQIAGSFSRGAPVTKSANFTLAATENWIIHTGAGSITCTLPAASSCTGREVCFSTYGQSIVSSASNIVSLDSATVSTTILAGISGQRWIVIVSDGTNWRQMMRGN